MVLIRVDGVGVGEYSANNTLRIDCFPSHILEGKSTFPKRYAQSSIIIKPDKRFILDLGSVNIAARVFINDKDLGVLWIQPFQMDITDALRSGKNSVRIEVTNLWPNRLIGDERYPNTSGYEPETWNPTHKMVDWYVRNEPMPASKRITFTTRNFYKETDKLVPSGLVGPVQVFVLKTINV